jgi:hypothetical protein
MIWSCHVVSCTVPQGESSNAKVARVSFVWQPFGHSVSPLQRSSRLLRTDTGNGPDAGDLLIILYW